MLHIFFQLSQNDNLMGRYVMQITASVTLLQIRGLFCCYIFSVWM